MNSDLSQVSMPTFPVRVLRPGSIIAIALSLLIVGCGSDSGSVSGTADTEQSTTDSGAMGSLVTDTIGTVNPDAGIGSPNVPATGGDDSTLYRDANNSAVLQGPVIGTGAVANASGFREVTVVVGDLGNGLALRSIRIFNNPQGILAEFAAVIENTSDRFACELLVVDGELVDQGGVVNDRKRAEFQTSGSIGAIPSIDGIVPGYRNECVLPGAMVYGYGTVSPVDDVIEVRGSGVNAREYDNTAYDGVVEPVSYEVQPDGQIDVLVANRGNLRVSLQQIDLYLLDSDGSVVGLLLGFGGPSLEPGAEGVMSVLNNNFAGQVTTVRAVVDFNGPNFLP